MHQDDETKTWSDVEVKLEQDGKELKNETENEMETELGSKPEIDENISTLADVDKFEPIESDEDEEMCDRLEIKTENDDSQDKSMETESFKHELISEDSKSQDDIGMQPTSDEAKVLNSEDFNIEGGKAEPEDLDKPADSIMSNVLPKNEIEDIQQKLHSFHSENLMILQTRNKKRASRATTPTSLDETGSNIGSKESLPSSSGGSEQTSKIHKFSADDRDYKRELSAKVQNDDESSYGQYHSVAAPPPIPPTATSQPVTATQTYSSYALNSVHRIEPNQPISSVQIYQTPPPASPSSASFPNVNPQLTSNMPSTNSLYHYLENQNRQPGFNTTYNAPPMFSIHTSVPPPTLLNSSNYLTKSYSTLSEPSLPVVNVPANVITPPSCSNNPINPKLLSRTQSADPRLNPQKDLPPVTPKRKLSINEYRKRKQLTNTTEKPKVESCEKSEGPVESEKPVQVEDKPKNGMSVVETKETGKLSIILKYIQSKLTLKTFLLCITLYFSV